MNYTKAYNLATTNANSESYMDDALNALRELYSNTDTPHHTKGRNIENFVIVHEYTLHTYLENAELKNEIHMLKNRSFMEKLKNLFSK